VKITTSGASARGAYPGVSLSSDMNGPGGVGKSWAVHPELIVVNTTANVAARSELLTCYGRSFWIDHRAGCWKCCGPESSNRLGTIRSCDNSRCGRSWHPLCAGEVAAERFHGDKWICPVCCAHSTILLADPICADTKQLVSKTTTSCGGVQSACYSDSRLQSSADITSSPCSSIKLNRSTAFRLIECDSPPHPNTADRRWHSFRDNAHSSAIDDCARTVPYQCARPVSPFPPVSPLLGVLQPTSVPSNIRRFRLIDCVSPPHPNGPEPIPLFSTIQHSTSSISSSSVSSFSSTEISSTPALLDVGTRPVQDLLFNHRPQPDLPRQCYDILRPRSIDNDCNPSDSHSPDSGY
jgi:hypothetical protein